MTPVSTVFDNHHYLKDKVLLDLLKTNRLLNKISILIQPVIIAERPAMK